MMSGFADKASAIKKATEIEKRFKIKMMVFNHDYI